MHRPILSLTLALGLTLAAFPAAAQIVTEANCAAPDHTPTGHIAWPADNPVWEFDFIRFSRSTGTEGSGVEIRDVYYRGRLVLRRGHIPVVNVLYDPGGCGCYRDWFDEESRFQADNPMPGQSCIALATPGTVVTTCENEGTDIGSFNGVAVEDYGNELVLTGHSRAGWYRYRMNWHFYLDGRIWPEFSAGATNTSSCVTRPHTHHAYWRLDFDLNGAENDRVREVNPTTGTNVVLAAETKRDWGNPADGVYWVVEDEAAEMSYRIIPSAADLLMPVTGLPDQTFDDEFAYMDAAVLRYQPNEIDDGVGFQSGNAYCAINFEDAGRPNGLFINDENVDGQDVVFWYRGGTRHAPELFHDDNCHIVGPTLELGAFPTGSGPGPGEVPAAGYVLERAAPNPFSATTTLRFAVSEAQHVTVALYDVTGRRVAVLFEGRMPADRQETVQVDGAPLPAGTYVVRLEGERVMGATRIVLLH
ncbi:MAG TPA: T9SS type A sorting domain-containing protein [Rubricoccaceae bacterium]|nr:T9SS type A sorting domain-containing protein [Rubricoccaceae bacterium]